MDVSLLVAVAEEGVWVWLALDFHPCPAVDGDPHVGGGDVGVGVEEVLGEDGGEVFGWVDGVEFGHDVGCVFLCVGGDDVAVVGVCPGGRDVAFQHRAYGHFCHVLRAVAVALDFV